MSEPAGPDERLARLERRLAELADRVAALENESPPARSAAVDERPGAARPRSERPIEPAAPAAPAAVEEDLMHGLPALVGRTLVVLGGAFAVRSLTEAGTLSPALGVTLGIAYAFVWLLFADRAARRGQALSGAFHALASALIVYPLLLEAGTRLALLAPVPAALLVVAANVAGLTVAWRRDSPAFAWIQQVATLVVTALLLFRTRAVLAFGLALLALAVASLVLAYRRGWRGQRWLVAIGVDAVVALLGALWLFGRTPPAWLGREALMALQIALAAIYLGAFVLRLLVQERQVTGFAMTQTVAVLLVGFEAALAVAAPGGRRALAIAALATGVVLHALLARRAEARVGHGAAVGYFASLATFLAAEAVRVLLPAAAPLVWLAAAAVLGALALGGERPILQAHAALLATAGVALSGLLRAAFAALALPARAVWPAAPPLALVQLALVAAVAVLLYRGSRQGSPSRLAVAARLLALSAALVAVGGQLARTLAAFVAAPGPAADPGHLATLRTAVLAAAALALAAAARRLGRSELFRLAAATLAIGGLKLVAEDLRQGSAVDLLFSLALYGAVLIAVPALARRARRAPAD